jgi:hypothetical protein
MKLIEKIFLVLFALAFVLKLADIAGGAMFLGVFGGFLQIAYFVASWYLFATKDKTTGEKHNNLIFSILAGWALSALIFSISWQPNPTVLPMLIMTCVIIFPFAFYKLFEKKEENILYYQLICLRGVLFVIFAAIKLFVS